MEGKSGGGQRIPYMNDGERNVGCCCMSWILDDTRSEREWRVVCSRDSHAGTERDCTYIRTGLFYMYDVEVTSKSLLGRSLRLYITLYTVVVCPICLSIQERVIFSISFVLEESLRNTLVNCMQDDIRNRC